jgi:hypothetical protein
MVIVVAMMATNYYTKYRTSNSGPDPIITCFRSHWGHHHSSDGGTNK